MTETIVTASSINSIGRPVLSFDADLCLNARFLTVIIPVHVIVEPSQFVGMSMYLTGFYLAAITNNRFRVSSFK